jgi:hypothetical protein
MKITSDRLSLLFCMVSAAFLFACYGGVVVKYRVFPYQIIALAEEGYRELFVKKSGIGSRAKYPDRPAIYTTGNACEGLNMVTCLTAKNMLAVKVMDLNGRTLHEWSIDWFTIWPDAKHVPDWMVPRSRPGVTIHGAVIMENGDLVFNFEYLGLVRLDLQGKVVWRLPYQTHHSIEKGDDGNLWVCGIKHHRERDPRFPNRLPPVEEETILEVSPDGTIRREWSVPDILIKNGLAGMLYLSIDDSSRRLPVHDAVFHMNDVEPFPSALKEGFFKRGDLLVSLRNINTVFVFNRDTEKISFLCTGMFVRQHDPDFVDGNTISVYDNNNIAPPEWGFPQSRILLISAPDKTAKVFFKGKPGTPFYAYWAGKHQWLANGNLLITESPQGRAFEINRQGDIVWEYINYVGDGLVCDVSEVHRLPPEYTTLFRVPGEEDPGRTGQSQ